MYCSQTLKHYCTKQLLIAAASGITVFPQPPQWMDRTAVHLLALSSQAKSCLSGGFLFWAKMPPWIICPSLSRLSYLLIIFVTLFHVRLSCSSIMLFVEAKRGMYL